MSDKCFYCGNDQSLAAIAKATGFRPDVAYVRMQELEKQLANHKKLHKAALEIKADLLMRADRETNPDGTICRVVDVSATRWEVFNKALSALSKGDNNGN